MWKYISRFLLNTKILSNNSGYFLLRVNLKPTKESWKDVAFKTRHCTISDSERSSTVWWSWACSKHTSPLFAIWQAPWRWKSSFIVDFVNQQWLKWPTQMLNFQRSGLSNGSKFKVLNFKTVPQASIQEPQVYNLSLLTTCSCAPPPQM